MTQSSLSSNASAELLKKGRTALMAERFEQAIELLEQYSDAATEQNDRYFRAQMWLVKAYQGAEQTEKAIALCQTLVEQDHAATKIWANRYLGQLMPKEPEPEEVSEPDTDIQTTSNAPASGAAVAAAMRVAQRAANPKNSGQMGASQQAAKEDAPPRRFLEKTAEDFRLFCRQELAGELLRVEKERNQVVTSLAIATGVGLIAFIFSLKFFIFAITLPEQVADYTASTVEYGGVLYETKQEIGLPWNLIFISLLCIFTTIWLWFAFCTSAMEAYSSGFKDPIVRRIVDFIAPQRELQYLKAGDWMEAKYAFSQSMLSEQPVKMLQLRQDSEVRGRLEGVDLIFSDIVAFREEKSWLRFLNMPLDWAGVMLRSRSFLSVIAIMVLSAALALRILKTLLFLLQLVIKRQSIKFSDFDKIVKGEVHHEVVFKGLFFRARFNQCIPSETLILPKTLATRSGFLNRWRGQQVKLEDPEFAKYFTVYGQDQIEARYVLSTALMDRLTTFRRKAKRQVSISMVNNMIYVAVQSGKDAFEPRLFYKMTGFGPLREYFENLQLMLGIVEDLKLNR